MPPNDKIAFLGQKSALQADKFSYPARKNIEISNLRSSVIKKLEKESSLDVLKEIDKILSKKFK